MADSKEITVIGGGLAGSEAAFQAAKRGLRVTLYEMKPKKFSPAHKEDGLAELVCSNSLKSMSTENATGLLKEEMRLLGSLIVRAAYETKVPAGGALAVDREAFSEFITSELTGLKVNIVRDEIVDIPEARPLIIATGPLTSEGLAESICAKLGEGGEYLYFYDAVSPVVHADSIDMEIAFKGSRYGKGSDDYINCPMDEETYRSFIAELLKADKVALREFEDTKYFEGCLPIEVMAERGEMTLAFGPMKPVGFTDPSTGQRPFAVVQLRMDNRAGTLYNIVGFQTRLTYGEQRRIFARIPGLSEARFARLGKIHRNLYIDSPKLLESTCELKSDPLLFFAGQITGVEGYSESSASGLIAGVNAARAIKGHSPVIPPETTMLGALQRYISDESLSSFQPMNSNFGLLPQIGGKKKERKAAYSARALKDLIEWKEKVLIEDTGCFE
ncbi:MAG: methylenetetrahydrofolate--tRNA-(uracil(54)-C(5))-methyltransferase (FADH(2)-oxidizing) TrmFO [Thermodesulfobacteriota bacterium]